MTARQPMTERGQRYHASYPKRPEPFSAEHLDLVRRRTQPFLKNGTSLSIEHLMQEAYIQGLRDAADAMLPPTERQKNDD